jgi:glycosyltransferase involved in cell wall biosynthesis
MSSALISVVIPTWRRAKLLTRAVQSVLEQDWRPIQLIVVNDGSDDETGLVLASLESRVRVQGITHVFLSQPHGGVSSARNAGLRAARGEYIAFLDDDDWWRPEKLSRQMAEFGKCRANACCCFTFRPGHEDWRPDPNSLFRGRDAARFVAREANAKITTLLLKAELLLRVGEFDESLSVYEDEEWKARLVHEADFCAVEESLVAYARSEESLSRVLSLEANLLRDRDFMRHLDLIRERCASRPGWSEQAWKERAAHVYDECAKHRLYVGDLEGARQLYERGIEVCGPIMALPKLRTKLRKAWWMSWLGLKPRHPKMQAEAAR